MDLPQITKKSQLLYCQVILAQRQHLNKMIQLSDQKMKNFKDHLRERGIYDRDINAIILEFDSLVGGDKLSGYDEKFVSSIQFGEYEPLLPPIKEYETVSETASENETSSDIGIEIQKIPHTPMASPIPSPLPSPLPEIPYVFEPLKSVQDRWAEWDSWYNPDSEWVDKGDPSNPLYETFGFSNPLYQKMTRPQSTIHDDAVDTGLLSETSPLLDKTSKMNSYSEPKTGDSPNEKDFKLLYDYGKSKSLLLFIPSGIVYDALWGGQSDTARLTSYIVGAKVGRYLKSTTGVLIYAADGLVEYFEQKEKHLHMKGWVRGIRYYKYNPAHFSDIKNMLDNRLDLDNYLIDEDGYLRYDFNGRCQLVEYDPVQGCYTI